MTKIEMIKNSMAKIKMGQATIEKGQRTQSEHNNTLVVAAYAERGIQATPKVDVFTSNAWLAKGRVVRPSERKNGVRIFTFYEKPDGTKVSRNVYVYHVSQTDLADSPAESAEVQEAETVADVNAAIAAS
jgi:hypothetical protein